MAKKSATVKKETFSICSPESKNVAVAGDFTSWELNPKPLKKNKQGVWSAIVSLEPGRYEYKFIVDGQWLADPACQEHSPDPFGGNNSVRIVV